MANLDFSNAGGATEIVNMVANVDGSMRIPAMGVNAVLIQLLEVEQGDGTTKLQRFVSIQCEDESLLPALREEARAYLLRSSSFPWVSS